MDVNKLLQALDNQQNEELLNFTTSKIKEMNAQILRELQLPSHEYAEMCRKLDGYKYVDEMNELKCGSFIRWISIENPDILILTKGAIFCELKITEQGVFCICRNIGFPSKHFRLSMETNLIFQKLTTQEVTLLSALDHLYMHS